MSWTYASTTGLAEDEITYDRVSDAVAKNAGGGDLSGEVAEQITTAVKAAHDIIDSGAIGSSEKYNVHLNGHANPGHEPKEGYGDDVIGVSVGQHRG